MEKIEKTELEITEEFIEEYKKLCKRYKRDFVQGEIHIIKVNFPDD